MCTLLDKKIVQKCVHNLQSELHFINDNGNLDDLETL